MARRSLLLALLAWTGGCSSVDPTAVVSGEGPPFGTNGASFRPVSALLEKRCATLDCHGSTYRPLRIYGQNGLRRPEPEGSPNVSDYSGYYSGGPVATTEAELRDNYLSIIALEPDLTQLVINDANADPSLLTLVRKPRLQEKHKGGAVWVTGKDPDNCLTRWLKGRDVAEVCLKALEE